MSLHKNNLLIVVSVMFHLLLHLFFFLLIILLRCQRFWPYSYRSPYSYCDAKSSAEPGCSSPLLREQEAARIGADAAVLERQWAGHQPTTQGMILTAGDGLCRKGWRLAPLLLSSGFRATEVEVKLLWSSAATIGVDARRRARFCGISRNQRPSQQHDRGVVVADWRFRLLRCLQKRLVFHRSSPLINAHAPLMHRSPPLRYSVGTYIVRVSSSRENYFSLTESKIR